VNLKLPAILASFSLTLGAPGVAAQWSVSAELGVARFGGTSRDSAGATVGPYRPTTFELRLERGAGRARVAVGVLHANTGLVAEGQGVAVVQYGIGSLWEIAPEVSLGVARFGAGLEARVAAGPAFDLCDPAAIICLACGGPFPWPPLPPPPPAVPGLYLTKAHFVDDFEGWLKGGPEFEVHILGQKGQTDSLTDYQCAGEKQPAPYYFDQDALDWNGSVMLFSKVQLDAYNAAHPGQNIRVFVVEDDDTACEIKANRDLIGALFKGVDGAYKALTAGNDSSNAVVKLFKRANAIQKLWAAIASFINTNDELVGTAVEDAVVGISYPGYNWIVKGQNNATNGWITLGMK